MDHTENEKIERGDFKVAKNRNYESHQDVKPKKIKKGGKIALILVSIFTILIAAPIATFYGLFYDNNQSDFRPDNHFDLNKELIDIPFNSLDSAQKDKSLKFSITEDLLNNILYDATKQIKQDTGGIINNFVIDIDEKAKSYHFCIEAAVPLFKTRLVIDTNLIGSEQESPEFIFQISNASIGRLNNIFDTAYQLAQQFVNDEFINNLFTNIGISIKSDLANKRLTYKKLDIISDMVNLIGHKENILDKLIEGFIENNTFTYDLCSNESMSAIVNLEQAHTNEKYCSPEYAPIVSGEKLNNENGLGYIQIIEKMANEYHLFDFKDSLLGNSEDTTWKNQINSVFNFLIRGYESANDKTTVDSVFSALSSDKIQQLINTTNYKEYKGAGLPAPVMKENEDEISKKINADVENSVKAQIDKVLHGQPVDKQGVLCEIYEQDINEVIQRINIIGGKNQIFYSYKYVSQDSDDIILKLNFISINNFYVNILKDSVYFVIGLNINGYDTSICGDTTIYIQNAYEAQFKINNFYIGNILAGPELSNWIFEYMLKEGVEIQNIGWFKGAQTIGGEKYVVFNFSTLLNSVKAKYASAGPAVQTIFDNSVVYGKGNNLTDHGSFVFAYDIK